jgi:lipoyl(octanoyl) transferase
VATFLLVPGLSPYPAVHALQRQLLEARIRDEIPDVVVLVEHASVITLGRQRSAAANVLAAGDVPVIDVERGGDVTWHGPGQLVAYPIVRLVGPRADLHRHLHALEDAVIGLLGELGLDGRRDARNTGVWLPEPDSPRKVCSIGIACRRWVTWHGLALNVDPDLAAFRRIHPCGFGAEIMTSLARHLTPVPLLGVLAERLVPHLASALDVTVDGPTRAVPVDAVRATLAENATS